jgi:ABC-type antimicrobial peptide transport system permease subunit
MIAGLPGTGIGGIFYLVIAIAMPIREVFHKIFNRTYRNRWGVIALTLGLVAAIFASLWAEVALVSAGCLWLQDVLQTDLHLNNAGLSEKLSAANAPIFAFMAASAAFITLGVLYVITRILGFYYARRAKRRSQVARPVFTPAQGLYARTSEPERVYVEQQRVLE